jgi:hypothetical protein
VLTDERACPHCGASLRTSSARAPALLLGLALTGCPTVEPVYGVPEDDGGPDDEETETETGMETGTDTGTDESDTTTAGEPEYGVPESG